MYDMSQFPSALSTLNVPEDCERQPRSAAGLNVVNGAVPLEDNIAAWNAF
jgi:hypothetical protein